MNPINTIHHLIALKLWFKKIQEGGKGRLSRRLLIVRGHRQDSLGREITLVASPYAWNFYHPRPRRTRPRKPAPAFRADLVTRQNKARPYPGAGERESP